ncbi:MAG TPA: hypothetical protein VHE35_13460 [Kofleriaceae bacterium]|nr:hypothetical protein [Kofleriaceae bacterium]
MRSWIACLLLAGCHQPGPGRATPSTAPADGAPATGTGPATFAGVLTAPAVVRSSAELTAHLVITNPGPDELVLTHGAVELAVLAVEVRDARDQRVPTVPPPVPRAEDAERLVLQPGQTLERDYRLDVFSPPLAPGDYALHCRMVACAPRRFTVAP